MTRVGTQLQRRGLRIRVCCRVAQDPLNCDRNVFQSLIKYRRSCACWQHATKCVIPPTHWTCANQRKEAERGSGVHVVVCKHVHDERLRGKKEGSWKCTQMRVEGTGDKPFVSAPPKQLAIADPLSIRDLSGWTGTSLTSTVACFREHKTVRRTVLCRNVNVQCPTVNEQCPGPSVSWAHGYSAPFRDTCVCCTLVLESLYCTVF